MMRRRPCSRSRARLLKLTVLTLLAASMAGVAVASYRFVTGSTATLRAGTLSLSDTDGGAAMFTLGTLRPDDEQTRCIKDTNTGGLSAGELELDAVATGTGLEDFLDVVIDRGTGAAAGASFSCTGFTVTTADLYRGTVDGLVADSPVDDAAGAAAGQVISYRVTIGLPADAPLAAQGKSLQLLLSWEASS